MGVRLDKNEYFIKFINEYQDFKKWLSQKKFTQWLEQFGKYYNIDFEHGRTHNMRFIEFKTENNDKQKETDTEFPF